MRAALLTVFIAAMLIPNGASAATHYVVGWKTGEKFVFADDQYIHVGTDGVRIWFHMIFNGSALENNIKSTRDLFIMDCNSGRYAVTTSVKYSENGEILNTEDYTDLPIQWHATIPNSIIEGMSKFACVDQATRDSTYPIVAPPETDQMEADRVYSVIVNKAKP